MEKEFVPYEIALRMKALGFNEPCLAWFSDRNIRVVGTNGCTVSHLPFNSSFKDDDEFVSAPTFSQAFRWFREKYDLHSLVCFDKQIDEIDDEELENPYFTYYYSINELWTKGKDYNKFTRGFVNIASNRDILSHEEAELDCLEKLIEIVEQKEKEL